MTPEEQMKERIGEEVAKTTAKKLGKIVATVVAVIGGVFLVIFLGFLFGWVIQWLWNNTLVEIFDWPKISYWQAVGVFVLAKIFFGFGHSGGQAHHKHKKSDEKEKEKVRQWWRGRLGATSDDQTSLSKDEMFKKYWTEEGKAAYEAYLAASKGSAQNDPQ